MNRILRNALLAYDTSATLSLLKHPLISISIHSPTSLERIKAYQKRPALASMNCPQSNQHVLFSKAAVFPYLDDVERLANISGPN